MNRMNNDGIIIVLPVPVLKKRSSEVTLLEKKNDTSHSSRITMVKNGDETVAVDCCHAGALCSHEPWIFSIAFILGIFLASFDWSTRSSSRRPARETKKKPSPRPSRYDSGLSLSFLEQHKRRRRRQERDKPLAQHPWLALVQPMKPKTKREHEK